MNELEYQKTKKIIRDFESKKSIQEEKDLGNWIESNIGKTFVYRNNSYGCSDETNKKWDCFYQIIAKKNNTTAICIEFQLIDSKNKIFEIKQSERYLFKWNKDDKDHLDHMPRCSLEEFEKIKKRILKIITTSLTDSEGKK
jgi:hypothetical protein